jgi:hypothetical protein
MMLILGGTNMAKFIVFGKISIIKVDVSPGVGSRSTLEPLQLFLHRLKWATWSIIL